MIVATTRAELRAARENLTGDIGESPPAQGRRRQPGGTGGRPPGRKLPGDIVLVPTMGALHDGHRALLAAARERAGETGAVAVSIFVNPLQFGPNEDLDRYPRTLPADLETCEAEHVDLVFAPSVDQMYPTEQLVTVNPGPAGEILEGEFRPGFFRGVLTVVLKLFSLVRPDVAVFGQKDAQQITLVRQMVADFALGIEIAAVPTVRAPDGLALSSRNNYLSPAQRTVAPVLYRALAVGAAATAGGPAAVLAAARGVLDGAGSALSVDYLELVEGGTYAPVRDDEFEGPAVLAVAARVGSTRLIDNVPVQIRTGQPGTVEHAADD